MNIKMTLTLAIILAGLSTYYYAFEIKGTQEKIAQEEKEKKLFDLAQSKITSFEYNNKQENIKAEFSQKNNEWYLEKPITYKGDNSNITSMLDSVVTAKFTEKVENSSKLEDFGLKEPRITLAIKTPEGDKIIKVGDDSPTNSSTYVMRDKDPNVYLFPTSVFYGLNKKLTDLRDKTIIKLDKELISSLELKNNNGNFLLSKKGTDWELNTPKPYKADNSKVEELFSKLQDEKITDFVDENAKDLAKYGLDKPKISLLFKNKENKESSFMLGNEIGDYTYAQNSDNKVIFKVNKSVTEKFKLTLGDLRNKNILSFSSMDINKVAIEALDNNLKAEKDKEQKWKIIQKDTKVKSTPEDVEAFVNKLSNLNFERTFDKENFTLGDKVINVTLEEKGKPIKITFGGITKDNKEQIYCLKNQGEEGYAINKNILEKIISN